MTSPRLFAVLAATVVFAGARPALADQCAETGNECFLSADGKRRDVHTAYELVVRRGDPAYWRALAWEAAALIGGTTWYWIDRERQVADWDYPAVEQRFTFEAWRYDNNIFPINFIWHPLNGVAFHLAGRWNNLSLSESVGFGFLTSMVWELGLEFREKVSINDVISTTAAGTSIGEFAHWLGRYVNSAPGNDVTRWTVGFPYALHNNWDDRVDALVGTPTDSLGFSADIWHRFQFSYGAGRGDVAPDVGVGEDETLPMHELRFDGQLFAMPGYLRPGTFRKFFREGNKTELVYRFAISGDGTGTDVLSDTVLLGVHAQDIPDDGVGHALTVGTNLSYQYRREEFGAWEDRLGIVHLPGVSADGYLLGPRWRLRLYGRFNGDFAGIHAGAYPRWEQANRDICPADSDEICAKQIVARQGYYYGWGWSTRWGAELSLPRVAVGGSVFYARYHSDEGLDRAQEEVVVDLRSHDTILDGDGWLRVTPFGGRWYVEGRVTHQRRRAWLEGFTDDRDLTRYQLRVGAEL